MASTSQYYFMKKSHTLFTDLPHSVQHWKIYAFFRTPDDTISSPKLCFLSAITAYHTNEDATCSEQFKLILLFLS